MSSGMYGPCVNRGLEREMAGEAGLVKLGYSRQV
jgi:hypothetical protein